MASNPTDLCIALRNWRISARIQQAEVARSLGVTQGQVSRWESGRDLPRPHNVEAIRRLIWGPEADPLLALRHFVEHSHQHLLLIDAGYTIIARSLVFQASPNPLDQFGWVLDPGANAAFVPVHRRLCDLLDHAGGVIGLTVVLPFLHHAEAWCVTVNMTIYSVAGIRVCLAEPHFARAAMLQTLDIRLEEIRLTPDRTERRSLTLWPQNATRL